MNVKNKIECFFGKNSTSKERLHILKTIHQEGDESPLKEEYIKYKNNEALFALVDRKGDLHEAEYQYKAFYKNKQRRKIRDVFWSVWGKVAVVLLIICSYFLLSQLLTNKDNHITNEISVPIGQRVFLTLNDGTQVWLNSNSKLSYPSTFNKKKRVVKLQGEGYFVVSPNKKKPFLVQTNKMELKVLGTTFNVCDYPKMETCNVSLINGAVEVSHLDLNRKIKMMPNQTISCSKSEMSLLKTDDLDHFSWIDGVLSFDNQSFDVIVSQLSTYYNVTILLENQDLSNIRYTGKFRQNDGVFEILHKMQKAHHFQIEYIEKDSLIILK